MKDFPCGRARWSGRFDNFWRSLAARAHQVAVGPARTPFAAGVERIEYTSLDGVRLGVWLTLPRTAIRSAVIVAHGYGGREELELWWAPEDAAVFYPVSRGLPALALIDGIPSDGAEVCCTASARAKRTCAVDVWCAISALEELLGVAVGEWNGGLRLGYFGPSFGGGIGALVIPWDDRIDAASLYVPSFGANVRRLAVPNEGGSAAMNVWVRDRDGSHPHPCADDRGRGA